MVNIEHLLRMRVLISICALTLLIICTEFCGASFQPLCRRPEIAPYCAGLGGNQTLCDNWSGCQWTNNSTCLPRTSCDPMKCEMSFLALKLSGQISPGCVRGEAAKCNAEMDEIATALLLPTSCFMNDAYHVSNLGNQTNFIMDKVDRNVSTVFVSFDEGSDANEGDARERPLRTIQAAVSKARAFNGERMIVLMAGKHHLTAPVTLEPLDSNLTFQGETGAVVTGSLSLANVSKWVDQGSGVFRADIPPDVLPYLDTLSVLSFKGEPMIRSQWPNKPTYLDFAFAPRTGIDRWTPRARRVPYVNITRRFVTSGVYRYKVFDSGAKGGCAGMFTPPIGYFCDPRADADINCEYSQSAAVRLKPAVAAAISLYNWTDQTTGFLHALHPLKWGGWTFALANASQSDPLTLRFSSGGFQEARGDCRNGGGEFYLENIRELLDAPREFFLDLVEGAVYFYPPEPIVNLEELELGARSTRLLDIKGKAEDPVRNIKFLNIRFERTYPIHMEPHEMPSGGDWTLHRSGTIYLDGVEKVLVADCEFANLGSHGIFASNYVRDLTVERNSFRGLDASAIMLVGDPKFSSSMPWDRRFDSDYVARVIIRHNMIREIGLMVIQSAGVFASIAKDVTTERNVIFNGPRAAVVFNDLFGWNMQTRENVMFNMVRRTLDHGPYNVWDRQQWMVPSGFKLLPNIVERNLLIGTAGGSKVVDLDDGARNHIVRNNVIAMGYPKFKGANVIMSNNTVVAYLQPSQFQVSCALVATSHQRPATGFIWSSNTCLAPGASKNVIPFAWALQSRSFCSAPRFTSANNVFQGVKINLLNCGGTNLQRWQGRNHQDGRSVFQSAPEYVSQIVAACENRIGSFT